MLENNEELSNLSKKILKSKYLEIHEKGIEKKNLKEDITCLIRAVFIKGEYKESCIYILLNLMIDQEKIISKNTENKIFEKIISIFVDIYDDINLIDEINEEELEECLDILRDIYQECNKHKISEYKSIEDCINVYKECIEIVYYLKNEEKEKVIEITVDILYKVVIENSISTSTKNKRKILEWIINELILKREGMINSVFSKRYLNKKEYL